MTLQRQVDELNRDNRLILASTATISVKRLGAQNPVYVQCGPTADGIEVYHSCEHELYGDDGTTGAIGALIVNEEMTIRFSLTQAGLYNMAVAMNADPETQIALTQPIVDPPSDGIVIFKCGGRRDSEIYEIKAQVAKPSGKMIREYIFHKAVPMVDFAIQHKHGQITVFDCRFRILMDMSQSDEEQLFKVVDYYDSDYGELESPNY